MTIVTKANIVKLADGNFIKAVRKVGEEYPEIGDPGTFSRRNVCKDAGS